MRNTETPDSSQPQFLSTHIYSPKSLRSDRVHNQMSHDMINGLCGFHCGSGFECEFRNGFRLRFTFRCDLETFLAEQTNPDHPVDNSTSLPTHCTLKFKSPTVFTMGYEPRRKSSKAKSIFFDVADFPSLVHLKLKGLSEPLFQPLQL
jgi:hypothetical protein